MRNFILSAMSAGLLFASTPATQADAAVRASINLNFGTPPQVYFARPPRPILIPDTQVYYVEGTDYDMFQCDGMWYVDNGGYWFESPSYRGPFESVSFESVPQEIIAIPTAYAHQPYRPGMWRSDSRSYGYGGSYGGGSYGQGWNNNRGWQGYNNRGWQGNNNRRWQNNDNRGWQSNDQRSWRNSDQRWQDRQGWQRDGQSGRGDQGNWNRGNGRGHGNGNGHGRGHEKNHDDD